MKTFLLELYTHAGPLLTRPEKMELPGRRDARQEPPMTPETFELKDANGKTFATVEVKKRIGVLVLHRSPKNEMWGITHIPTGFACGRYHTYRIGLACLKALAALPSWEKITKAGPEPDTNELFKKAGEIVSRYRNLFSDAQLDAQKKKEGQ